MSRPKQSTRLLKAECTECGYVVRVTRKWLDQMGAPHCADLDHGQMSWEGGNDDEGDDGE